MSAYEDLANLVAVIRDDDKYKARVEELAEFERTTKAALDETMQLAAKIEEDRAHATAEKGEMARLHNELEQSLKPQLATVQAAARTQIDRDVALNTREKENDDYARELKALQARLDRRMQELDEKDSTLNAKHVEVDALQKVLRDKLAKINEVAVNA